MKYQYVRSKLEFTSQALENKVIRLGFLGGSITENRVPHNWPEEIIRYFTKTHPDTKVIVENAAIGATGSDLGLIRVENDIIDRKCDLVFIEYAVNDYWTPHQQRMDQMEGLIRRLKRYGKCDIVLVYTYLQEMYHNLQNNELPNVIKEYELLAQHYQINSVFAGAIAFDMVKAGLLKFEEWLPDGLHPQYRGSLIYGNAVISLIEEALNTSNKAQKTLEPLSKSHWENAELLPLDELTWHHPFHLKRSSTQAFINYVLYTSAIGAELNIDFDGRGVMLVFDFGKKSSEFKYSIDNEPWKETNRDRPQWCGNSGWIRPILLADQLPMGKHRLKIEVIHGNLPSCEGSNFDLTHVLVLK